MGFYNKISFINSMIICIKKCNKFVLEIYNKDFSVEFKDDKSPLTLADKECNKIICKFLENINKSLNLNIGIISEESKNDSYLNRSKLEYVWLVDPIDGTKEFVKKNGQFTVNIGLARYGVPVFGIVSIPVSGEIFYGGKNMGSFKIDKFNNKKRLFIKKKNYNTNGVNVVASLSHINDKTKKFISQFNQPNIVSTGSSIKLLLVAENKADIYPRIAPTSEWDICAAHSIVKYAGGKVMIYNKDVKFYNLNNEVKYNKENLLNPHFVVF